MKFNKWTLGLAAVGAVSLTSAATARAVEMNSSPVEAFVNGITISGYVDTSIEHTFCPDAELPDFDSWGNIPFRGYYKANGFNLNVVKLTIEKPLDESEWASGFKLDLLFGPDAANYNPSYIGNGIADTSSAGDYNNLGQSTSWADFGIKQAYVALRAPVGNGLDMKIGVFDTIIGYEVFESPNDPNFTRSWGWSLEPTQHTGILFSYRFSDMVGAQFGIANTLMPGINARNISGGFENGGYNYADSMQNFWCKTLMGSLTLTAPDDWGFLAGSTLYGGMVYGFAGGPTDQANYYVGAVINTPVTGLTTGLAFDYVCNKGGNVEDYLFGGYEDSPAYTIAAYGSYQATEKLSFHGRAEYGKIYYSSTDFGDTGREEIVGITGTVRYDLWQNVITRLEARYDHLCGKGNEFGEFSYAFDEDSFSLYLNVIYMF